MLAIDTHADPKFVSFGGIKPISLIISFLLKYNEDRNPIKFLSNAVASNHISIASALITNGALNTNDVIDFNEKNTYPLHLVLLKTTIDKNFKEICLCLINNIYYTKNELKSAIKRAKSEDFKQIFINKINDIYSQKHHQKQTLIRK
ncbi:MAG: hypothetical protein ABH827_02340 [bacterium]